MSDFLYWFDTENTLDPLVMTAVMHLWFERQRKVFNMLFDGFEGKLNSSKWYKINHCSQDTANRDIRDLITKGILKPTGEGGRSSNYELVFPLVGKESVNPLYM